MKLLWIVNMVLPPLADALSISGGMSGTWMFDWADRLDKSNDVNFAVACVCGTEFKKVIVGNTTYYCLPGTGRDMMFYNPKYKKYWHKIVDEFKPDVVNIHGTEYCHALSFVREYSDKIKIVISLQGVLNEIQNRDLANLSIFSILKNKTLKEWVRFNGAYEMHLLHKKNVKSEKEMLQKANYCMAVDTWHKAQALLLNPQLRVFTVKYNLRSAFYSSPKWDINQIERHTITTNPGGTPLKGLHMLLKAVYLLKTKYPDILVRVPGMSSDGKKLKISSGYSKYIGKLIDKLGLHNHVVFLGAQSTEQMIHNMSSSHVLVVPSAIEGPSLILHEGMHLGVPTIASFRGGMADYVDDKINGFLYDYPEYSYLATRISEIFDNDELANRLSHNSVIKSEKEHDPEKNYFDYLNMIYTIYNGDAV